MTLSPELARLTAQVSSKAPLDLAALQRAGEELRFEWPADYLALMEAHAGGEGLIGERYLQLWAADELVPFNRAQQEAPAWLQPTEVAEWMKPHLDAWQKQAPPQPAELRPSLVFFGSNGAEELLAFDRETRCVLLVPAIGGDEDAILLGSNLTEALGHFERGHVLDNPVYPRRQGDAD